MSAMTLIANSLTRNPLARFYKRYIIDSLLMIKRFGFKEFARRSGKRFIMAIVAYYLVRDTLLYIVIPFCIAKGVF